MHSKTEDAMHPRSGASPTPTLSSQITNYRSSHTHERLRTPTRGHERPFKPASTCAQTSPSQSRRVAVPARTFLCWFPDADGRVRTPTDAFFVLLLSSRSSRLCGIFKNHRNEKSNHIPP